MTTTPPFHDLPPLRSDADVAARVEQLVGPAIADRTLWLFLVDGVGRQAPIVIPVEGLAAACRDAGVVSRGVHLVTARRARRL